MIIDPKLKKYLDVAEVIIKAMKSVAEEPKKPKRPKKEKK